MRAKLKQVFDRKIQVKTNTRLEINTTLDSWLCKAALSESKVVAAAARGHLLSQQFVIHLYNFIFNGTRSQ